MKEDTMQKLEDLIKQLPPDLQKEAADYVEFLLQKYKLKERRRPRFRWAGALKAMRKQYTSVELQHQITRWRTGAE